MLWPAWYPYILPEVSGAPEVLVDHVLRQTAISFFEETEVWTVALTAIDLVANTGTYSLVAPAQTITNPTLTEVPDVAMVKWAWVDGQQIFPTSQEELGALPYQWNDKTAAQVSNYTQLTQDTITLFPIPDFASTGGLVITCAIQPSLTATGLPDWLGSKYIQALADGTKATMMGMVGKPWSNPEGEKKYAAAYANAQTKGTVEGHRSFTRTTQTVRFPRYG